MAGGRKADERPPNPNPATAPAAPVAPAAALVVAPVVDPVAAPVVDHPVYGDAVIVVARESADPIDPTVPTEPALLGVGWDDAAAEGR